MSFRSTDDENLVGPVPTPSLAWVMERDEPRLRQVEGITIYEPTSGLLGLQEAELLALLSRPPAEALLTAATLYRQQLDSARQNLLAKYEKKSGLFLPKNWRYLAWQYLTDMTVALEQAEANFAPAPDSSKPFSPHLNHRFHATTAEYNMLCQYIQRGLPYTEKLKPEGLIEGTTRYSTPPDANLVIFVSGFKSNWQSAVREAYATCYKLGYALEDIYIFNYKPAATQPLRLADFMDSNARLVGKYKIYAELEKAVSQGLYQNDPAARNDLQNLQLDQDISRFTFTETDNMNTPVLVNSQSLADQLRAIPQLRAQAGEVAKTGGSGAETFRRINLIAQSQGGAVAGGFLLQTNANGTPIFDAALKQFVDKYALLISAHGGAYLAQTASILRQARPLLYWPIRWLKSDIVASPKVQDLALDSQFIQTNYARLYSPDEAGNPVYNPAIKTHLENHPGIEIYAANDDITTSLPLATLPSTRLVRMIGGRHQEIIIGEGPNAGNRANRYLWLFFNSNSGATQSTPLPRNYESDRLLLAGYLKRGLPDYDIVAYTSGLTFTLLRFFFKTPQAVISFLIGESGIVDYPVYQQVTQANGERVKLRKPAFTPVLNFHDFLRGD